MPRGLAYLEQLPPWDGRGGFTLALSQRLLSALGNPQDSYRSVHVAGTNGKGSVCAFLASILRQSGARVGMITSPHLTRVTERCLINGAEIPDQQLSAAIDDVVEVAQQLKLEPSYFELITVASFLGLARAEVEWAVVEVGLGGRLDATNTITRPEAAVITSIGLDHTDILGGTLEAIAVEKAGIIKFGVPVFVGYVSENVRETISSEANRLSAAAEFMGVNFDLADVRDDVKKAEQRPKRYIRLPTAWCAEKPAYFVKNAGLAARVAQALDISDQQILSGLEQAQWPGRAELNIQPSLIRSETDLHGVARVRCSSDLLFDVAHNPEGMEALVVYLRRLLAGYSALTIVFSALDRKDWRSILDILAEFADEMRVKRELLVRWVFTRASHPNVVDPRELSSYLSRGVVFDEPEAALYYAAQCGAAEHIQERGLVAVTGSVFLVGRLRPLVVAKQQH